MSTLLPTSLAAQVPGNDNNSQTVVASAATVKSPPPNVLEFSSNSSNGFTIATATTGTASTNLPDSRANSLLGASTLVPIIEPAAQQVAKEPPTEEKLSSSSINQQNQEPVVDFDQVLTTNLLHDANEQQHHPSQRQDMDLDVESNNSRLTIDNDFFAPVSNNTHQVGATKLLVDVDDEEDPDEAQVLGDESRNDEVPTPTSSDRKSTTTNAAKTSSASINKDGYVIDDKCHLNYAWPDYDTVKYSRARVGRQLSVTQPNHAGPIEVHDSETVLFTKGVGVAMQIGDAASLSKCAHFHYNGRCIRGKGCSFVHAITIDPEAKVGQMAPLMLNRTTKGSVVPTPARRPERRTSSSSSHNLAGGVSIPSNTNPPHLPASTVVMSVPVTREVVPVAPDYLATTNRNCPETLPMPPSHHHQQQQLHPIHQQQMLARQQYQPQQMMAPAPASQQYVTAAVGAAPSQQGMMWIPAEPAIHHQPVVVPPAPMVPTASAAHVAAAAGYYLVPASNLTTTTATTPSVLPVVQHHQQSTPAVMMQQPQQGPPLIYFPSNQQ